ncbi:MAG: hypothetical protein H0V17_15865 [Deltaproteobacteria bacterium]|nr:hypothetical protein [Deltaproteobacteria bacterium]
MQPVRAGRAAIVAGAMVAAIVMAVYCIRIVPDRVVSMLGGPSGGVDRWGGLRVRYQPPAGSDAAIAEYLAQRANVQRDGTALLLEFPGIAEDTAADVIDVLIAGGLAMKESLETNWAFDIARDNELVNSEPDREASDEEPSARDDVGLARLELDYWQAEDGSTHKTAFLQAPTRRAIEAAIELAKTRGFRLEPGQEIAFENIDPEHHERVPRKEVRAYLLAREVLISGTMIDSAVGSYEPNSGRAIILLDFTSDAADRFCEITERLSGKKMATLLGGRIRSAPIINGPICGGRASITMGNTDPQQQERERDALVEVLQHGALPTGGAILDKRWTPAPDVATQVALGRLLLGLLAGLAAALIVFGVLRFARPVHTPRTVFAGNFPWRRLLVTAIAPVALYIGAHITIPGVNDAEVDFMLRANTDEGSVIALGLGPVMLAFFFVELAALAIPALRWRRHDPLGRVRLGQAVAVLAMGFALVHGLLVAMSFEQAGFHGNSIVDFPGWNFRLMMMLSVTAGSLLLAIVAGVISEHGLGNGYGVVMATGIAFDILPDLHFVDPLSAEFGLGLLVFLMLTGAAMFVLRWRVVAARQPALRLPTSAVSPLADTGAFLLLVVSLTGFTFGVDPWRFFDWASQLNEPKIRMLLVALSIPIWAWVFARPKVIERVALQAGLDRPTTATWLRATALSALLVLAGGVISAIALAHSPAHPLINAISALVFAAVLLDVIADAGARRAKLAIAGVVHQVQYLGVIEHVLGDAKIPHHCHASHLRSLFAFFGPWAPVHVLVPEEHAMEARLKIDEVLRASRGQVPEARAV